MVRRIYSDVAKTNQVFEIKSALEDRKEDLSVTQYLMKISDLFSLECKADTRAVDLIYFFITP